MVVVCAAQRGAKLDDGGVVLGASEGHNFRPQHASRGGKVGLGRVKMTYRFP